MAQKKKKKAKKKKSARGKEWTVSWAGLQRSFDTSDAAHTFRLGLISRWPTMKEHIVVRG
jgi:hypothetical protein